MVTERNTICASDRCVRLLLGQEYGPMVKMGPIEVKAVHGPEEEGGPIRHGPKDEMMGRQEYGPLEFL